MEVLYAIISVLVVSLMSVVVAVPFFLKRKIPNSVLLFLLSISVGVLLSTVFMDFLPETIDMGYSTDTALYILLGFIIMFVMEKLIHWHHNKDCENGDCGHSHAYNLAPINLIGDGIHNFLDGMVIVGAYAANMTLGVTATISIIFHEIPQELADFGVLLYSGYSKKRALLFNFLSAITAFIGLAFGLILINRDNFQEFIIPFAAGNFLYIAASNLLPQLHRHCKLKETMLHILAILLGVAIIAVVLTWGPKH